MAYSSNFLKNHIVAVPQINAIEEEKFKNNAFQLEDYYLNYRTPLVHDFIYVKKGELYQLYINSNNQITSDQTDTTMYISRLEVDRIFMDHMKQEGVGKIKRYLCYYGVRWFGGMFWKEKKK